MQMRKRENHNHNNNKNVDVEMHLPEHWRKKKQITSERWKDKERKMSNWIDGRIEILKMCCTYVQKVSSDAACM